MRLETPCPLPSQPKTQRLTAEHQVPTLHLPEQAFHLGGPGRGMA